jgi:hypothetical protein
MILNAFLRTFNNRPTPEREHRFSSVTTFAIGNTVPSGVVTCFGGQ